MRRSRSWTSGWLAVQHFRDQVLGDGAVAAGELRDEPLGIRVASQGDRREPQARGPPLGPLVQQRGPGFGQRDTQGVEQLAGLMLGEAQVGRADLGQLAGQAQLMQPQPQIVTRGQQGVHVRRKVGQQPAELSECLRRIQLMEVIDDHRDAGAGIGELRQHPVNHCRCVEVRRRGRRSRPAGRGASVTDRVEQGQPELLGVLLIALYLQHREPAALTRTVSPGAQQRRLPAAGRSRDDRHLPGHGAIQGSEKIAPVDQPGSCSSHRQRPALVSTPDTLTSVTQSGHLSSRYQVCA